MSRKILLLSKPEVLALLRGHSITRDGVRIIPDDDLCDLAAEVNNLVAMPDPRTWVPREVRPTRVPLCGKCANRIIEKFPVGSVAHSIGGGSDGQPRSECPYLDFYVDRLCQSETQSP